jgi:hypothetical protein
MREGLRKVARYFARFGVVLLREESDIIAQAEEPFEQFSRLAVATLEGEIVGKPERAEEE